MNGENSIVESAPADNPGADSQSPLTEDLALSSLKNPDLSAAQIEQLIKDCSPLKSRKVRLAIAAHARAPRRLALRIIREFYTFELMKFSLLLAAPADLRRMADELLVSRLTSISLGDRLSLARRCSPSVAAALLLDKESRVWQVALENARLTEAAVVTALHRSHSGPSLVEAVCRHPKWSVRPEVRMALLRNAHTPLARALEFAQRLQPALLRDLLHTSKLPEKIKVYLRREKEAPAGHARTAKSKAARKRT